MKKYQNIVKQQKEIKKMSKPKNKYAVFLGMSPQLFAYNKRTDNWKYKEVERIAEHFKIDCKDVIKELRGIKQENNKEDKKIKKVREKLE